MARTEPNKSTGVFNVKSYPKQFVTVKREFYIHQPDVERQLKHCVRSVKTISSIRHSFTNKNQNKLAYEFEKFAKDLVEFHHWRLTHHLEQVRKQVAIQEANGYIFNNSGKAGAIEVTIKSAYFGRLIDILLDMDEFMQHSAKLSLTGNYMANDISELNGKVVGVIRDINSTMQSIKATLSSEFGLTSEQVKAKINDKTINFDVVKDSVERFYNAQRALFSEIKDKTAKGDSSLVDKRNLSVTMETKENNLPKNNNHRDAFDLAFVDKE
ncbi:hypothetical protein [Alteromonas sp. BZK5]|uniref:hypothetical protein n=1 Tax=Alteromonas sp. BZK5 TaxID=1904459 RepID=UPI0016535B10|nr:hypothetical protein [Alteromonas sp. BZK5]MBC6987716.1 hypothetical protein [Alteromonas sp. BZK5]